MLKIGTAHWDQTNKVLYQDGQAVRLPRRALECLEMLVGANGQVIRKEDLQSKLWDGRVVEESNLGQCISSLRKALGADAIETVVGVGYRLRLSPQEAEVASVGKPIGRFSFAYLAVPLLLVVVFAWAGFRWPGRTGARAEADRLYREGIALLRAGSLAKGMQGASLFEQALVLDPNHALSYAGLAEAAARFSKLANDSPRSLAQKALTIDPNCAECKAVLGYALMTRDFDWAGAGKALEAALQQDPKPTQWRLWRAQWLATQRRLEEAKKMLVGAVADDPSKVAVRTMLAGVHYFRQDFKEAVAECDRANGINPSHTAPYFWAYRAHWAAGDFDSAVVMHAIETVRWGAGSADLETARRADYMSRFRKFGIDKLAEDWLAEFSAGAAREQARCERALWMLKLGRREEALKELEAAAISRPFHSIYLAVDPAYSTFWREPRFQSVLKKLGLPLPN